MSSKPAPGSRWKSAVCDTETVLVRSHATDDLLECGGVPMVPFVAEKPTGLAIAPEFAGGSLMGKRYADTESGLEMLCTKPGAGTLAIGGRRLTIKEAKKLPSSD